MNRKSHEKITDRTHKISLNEIPIALSKSGYFLEQRSRKQFERGGFSAVTNTSFLDPYTTKSREIDLEAEYWRKPFDDMDGNVVLKVIAECKNKFQPIVFFKATSGLVSKIEFEWRIKGSPSFIVDYENNRVATISIEDDLATRHVWTSEKCTQWCTFKYNEKIESWVASGDEDDYLSLQSLMIATKERADAFHKSVRGTEFLLGIFQPVLILQNELYIAEEDGPTVKLKPVKKLALRTQFTPSNEGKAALQENFMIDVISEDYLPEYIQKLKSGMGTLETLLKSKKELIEREMASRQGH